LYDSAKIRTDNANSLNLDSTKIGKGTDVRVHVKQMHCLPILMDLFWLMYWVIEEKNDHAIFKEASLLNPNES
jgi:hypothetical protein